MAVQYADNDGVKIAYEVLGEGPPILRHGGNWATLPLGRLFWQALPQLYRGYQGVNFDSRGMGESDKPEGRYDLKTGAADVIAVLDHCGVERAIVEAITPSGPACIQLAHLYPERVAALILGSTTPRFTRDYDFPYGMTEAMWQALKTMWLASPRIAGADVSRVYGLPDELASAAAASLSTAPQSVRSIILTLGETIDTRPLLPQLRVPVLITHSVDDIMIPVEAAHYMHEQIPGSQLHLQSGSWWDIVRSDEYIMAVRRFMGEHSPKP